MLRDLVGRIMVVFRLAVVVSLVGYTMPNAYAAMHGSAFSDVEATPADASHGDGHAHSHGAATELSDIGHHGDDGGASGKQAKNDCCQDFCFSIALPSIYQSFDPLMVSTSLPMFDDSRIHGIRPSLHRPPNI